jgi:7-carboxy-7-deazaguanine synthase
MEKFKVIEKFTSVDGEGPSAGELATFIRFLGCDLRCSWCDTAYSWDGEVKAELMTAEEIYQFIKASGAHNVTLTGGEPLIQKGISELIGVLLEDGMLTIRIETHGGVDISPFKEEFDLLVAPYDLQFIVDFKLPDSGMYEKMCWDNLSFVGFHDTYKFVIASEADLNEAIKIVRDHQLAGRCHVYFSPVASLIEPKVIVERMIREKLNDVKLQLQLHKYIWPKDMRGV